MMYDYSKLKGRIIEMYDSFGSFAEAIGISRQAVSNVLNGHTQFTASSIELWRNALDIPASEIGLYFFTLKVDK